ncbi:MAG: homoserine dehydrogenase, partial [Rhizobiales bacterium]|nr:homoserine dehydrogenase [Hyphomicrobiales bacterium]
MFHGEQAALGCGRLGTVGGGLLDLLDKHGQAIAEKAGREVVVTGVSARTKSKARGHDLKSVEWFDTPQALAASGKIDVFVELIGGDGDPAKSAVEAALAEGKTVITANKALLAHHGAALSKKAEATGAGLFFEAAVAGGIPIVKTLREGLA